MNKLTTAALVGMLAVTAGAQASASRWNGFGASQAFIADVQNIFTLPGVVASNADTTYFELGQTGVLNARNSTTVNSYAISNNAWGGVHSKLGGGVLGIWFNTMSKTLANIDAGYTQPQTTTGIPVAAFQAAVQAQLNNQLALFYGFGLGDSTTLGVGVSRGVASSTSETVATAGTSNNDTSINDLGLSLGLEEKGLGPISLLEVGLLFSTRNDAQTVKGTNATDKLTADGTNIALRVGGDMTGDNGKFSRIELGFSTSGLSLKTAPQNATVANTFVESKNSAMLWNAGYAMGMSSDKGMGLMGLMLKNKGQSRDEAFNGGAAAEVNKTNFNTLDLLVSTAGEAKINNWLAFRAGLESDIFYSKTTVTEQGAAGNTSKLTVNNNAHAGTVGDENAKASMGVTFTLGDLVLDGVLNQGLLYTGPYLISGLPGGLSSQVSLTWPWGGSKQ